MQAVSTSKQTRSKKGKTLSDEALDDWAQSVPPPNNCRTCAAGSIAETLRRLLTALTRNKIRHVTIRQLHKKLRDVHPDYIIGYWGFRDHLYQCERELYDKMREHK